MRNCRFAGLFLRLFAPPSPPFLFSILLLLLFFSSVLPLKLFHRFPPMWLGAKGLVVVAVSIATVQAPKPSLWPPTRLGDQALWCLAPLHPLPLLSGRRVEQTLIQRCCSPGTNVFNVDIFYGIFYERLGTVQRIRWPRRITRRKYMLLSFALGLNNFRTTEMIHCFLFHSRNALSNKGDIFGFQLHTVNTLYYEVFCLGNTLRERRKKRAWEIDISITFRSPRGQHAL